MQLFKLSQFSSDILSKRQKEDISLPKAVEQMKGEVSMNALWRAELGQKVPSLEIFARICKWLGKPVETYFITFNPSKNGKATKPVRTGASKPGKPSSGSKPKPKPKSKSKPSSNKKNNPGNSTKGIGYGVVHTAGRDNEVGERSVPVSTAE